MARTGACLIIWVIIGAFGINAQTLTLSHVERFADVPDWLPLHCKAIVTEKGSYFQHPYYRTLHPLERAVVFPKLNLDLKEKEHSGPYVEIVREHRINYLDIKEDRIWILTDRLYAFDFSGNKISKSSRLGPRGAYFDGFFRVTTYEVNLGHAFGSPEQGLWMRPGRRFTDKELTQVEKGEEIVMWQIFQNQSKAGAKNMKFKEIATIRHARHDTSWRPCDWESFGAYSRDQKLIYVTYNDADFVNVHDLDGRLIRSIRHSRPMETLPSSKRTTYIDGRSYRYHLPRLKPRYSSIFLSEDSKKAFRIFHYGATEEEMERTAKNPTASTFFGFQSAIVEIDLATGATKQYPVPQGMYVVSVMGGKVYLRKADERPGDIGLHVYQMTD